MVTKPPKGNGPTISGVLGVLYVLALLGSCSASGESAGADITFLALLGIGAVWLVTDHPRVQVLTDRLHRRCAVCGQANRAGHGCHLEVIGRPVGTRRNRNGSWGTTWQAVVRDHYGPLWECSHTHRYRQEAHKCGWAQLRATQRDPDRAGAVVGPRPGAETMVHRVRLTGVDWPKLMRETDYRCHYCGEQFAPVDLEREHKTPLSRGGSNHESNIVPSCAPCNRQKGQMTAEEYFEFRAKVAERGLGAVQRPATDRKRPLVRRRPTALPPPKVANRYPGSCSCGGTFRLKSGPWGRFYGCSRFPTCRETRPLAKDR